MANTVEMIQFAITLKPDFCCIVPEKREEKTTEGGLSLSSYTDKQIASLKTTITDFRNHKIKTSLFIDPDNRSIDIAKDVGADLVELHTGKYANQFNTINEFESFILPRKTVFQLCSILSETKEKLTIQISENKVKFSMGNMRLISKVIDGKFPDYKKVVPSGNDKVLFVESKDFINSIERVASVSLDRKEGVKLFINKDNVQLSVNSANSGDGNEKINAKFSSDNLNISFNSKYLIDIASEVEDKNLKINFRDAVSPVLIEDVSDKNSYYVIMPMKI